MNKICLALALMILAAQSYADDGFNRNEITYLVTMSANEKTTSQIDDFSTFYHVLVEGNEPGTLAWQFYRGSDEKIYLIERYASSDAALQHVINISPGGIQEKEFGDFSDHFVIENIAIHGNPSTQLVESLKAVGLPLEFRSTVSGYSRH